MRTFRIGAVDEFQDRAKRVVKLDDEEVGVFRMGDEFFAWRNSCPHQGGPVCQGRLFSLVQENLDENKKSHGRLYDNDKLNIVCPWHGLEFDVRTGKHPGNDEVALKSFPIQIEGGEIYVLLTE